MGYLGLCLRIVACLALASCGGDPAPALREGGVGCGVVGRSVGCVGRGGCAGGQVCQDDGTYSVCDCSYDGGTGPDAGQDGGDMPLPDAGGPMDASVGASCNVGTACERDSDCVGGTCEAPLTADHSVFGLGTLTEQLFPGGFCTPMPLSPLDAPGACDPRDPPALQGCGACGVCAALFWEDQLLTVCHERCTPSVDDNGCARDEYTCNLSLNMCVAGCVSDEECRVDAIDGNRDGIADGYVYQEDSARVCDMVTRRCRHPGTVGAQAGDPCQVADDCEADGVCFDDSYDFSAVPFVGGSCAKPGCDVPGLECAGEGVCADGRDWIGGAGLGRSCVKPCDQGTEAVGDQLGVAGHGAGCRDGYMCQWTGEPGGTSGMCMPGNYNPVAANNLGQQCTTQEECFSPFGHGRCLLLSPASPVGVCVILDCAAPGMPLDVCGPNTVCTQFGGDLTVCAQGCSDASECAPTLGCLLTGAGGGICAPGCLNAGECRVGESCDLATGLCVAP